MEAFKKHDFHAGLIETSVMLYWKPELVRKDIQVDKGKVYEDMKVHPDNYLLVEKAFNNKYVVPQLKQKPEIKVGVMGDPRGANAELGAKVCKEMVSGLSKLIRDIERK